MDSEYRLVGKIKDAHGLKGELYVLVFSGDISWLNKLSEFEMKDPDSGKSFKFKAVQCKAFKKGFILALDGVTDRTHAEKYHGYSFLIPNDLLVSNPGETIFLSEINGFHILDLNHQDLGKIIGFSSNGTQDLLVVQGPKSQAEIPFVAPFIKDIDFKAQTIVMDLPEGLFDLENIE